MKEYIEREAAETAVANYFGFTSARASVAAEKILSTVPAADVVEVRHGRWLIPLSPYEWYTCSCDQCGYKALDSGWTAELWEMDWYEEQFKSFVEAHPFCTGCGAKMDGGVNDGKAD